MTHRFLACQYARNVSAIKHGRDKEGSNEGGVLRCLLLVFNWGSTVERWKWRSGSQVLMTPGNWGYERLVHQSIPNSWWCFSHLAFLPFITIPEMNKCLFIIPKPGGTSGKEPTYQFRETQETWVSKEGGGRFWSFYHWPWSGPSPPRDCTQHGWQGSLSFHAHLNFSLHWVMSPNILK